VMPVSVDSFDTLDQAALAAEHACESMSFHSGNEFGGVLLERDGRYVYSLAQTSGMPSHFELRASFTSEYKLVGLYHTHPQGFDGEVTRWFSVEDVRVANTLKVPSYIGVEYEHGDVRKFTPGKTATTTERAAGYVMGKIALGEVIK
jgi:hypothetical protein